MWTLTRDLRKIPYTQGHVNMRLVWVLSHNSCAHVVAMWEVNLKSWRDRPNKKIQTVSNSKLPRKQRIWRLRLHVWFFLECLRPYILRWNDLILSSAIGRDLQGQSFNAPKKRGKTQHSKWKPLPCSKRYWYYCILRTVFQLEVRSPVLTSLSSSGRADFS